MSEGRYDISTSLKQFLEHSAIFTLISAPLFPLPHAEGTSSPPCFLLTQYSHTCEEVNMHRGPVPPSCLKCSPSYTQTHRFSIKHKHLDTTLTRNTNTAL